MSQIQFNVKLQPKQRELLEYANSGKARIIVFGGARGGAKSSGARYVALARAFQYPGAAALILRKSFPELVRNHITPLFREFPELREFYNSQEKTLRLPNGSTMEFQSANDQGRLVRLQGAAWETIDVDEATQFVEEDLVWLQMTNRNDGNKQIRPCMLFTANPGGPGHSFIKRIIDGKFHDWENPKDYHFIQSFVFDNAFWSSQALEEDGFTEKDYYGWTDERRKEYCLARSGYGKVLASMPPRLRAAHLEGDWSVFAGQYFDVFDPAVHVRSVEEMQLNDNHYKWIAMDWGFAHNSAIHWLAYNPELDKYCVYREMMAKETRITEIGRRIIDLTDTRHETLKDFYLSPDAFARKEDENTLDQQIDGVLRPAGFPSPTRAVTNRVAGWQFLYELLASDRLWIADTCRDLIQSLPALIRDEDGDPEDVKKVDGDDSADSLRMGLMSHLRAPREDDIDTQIQKHVKSKDPTMVAIQSRRAEAKLRMQYRPRRVARGPRF